MSRSHRSRHRTRDVYTPIARQSLRSVFSPSSPLIFPLRPLRGLIPRSQNDSLTAYEDRRTWHPARKAVRVPRSFRGSTRLQIGPSRHLAKYPTPVIQFAAPHRVLVCVRRHIRREVLYAFNKAGRGGQLSPRWTAWSSVNC